MECPLHDTDQLMEAVRGRHRSGDDFNEYPPRDNLWPPLAFEHSQRLANHDHGIGQHHIFRI
jgi:hypothetical protein